MFLKIAAQAFEARNFLKIFLRFFGFWGSFSYKKLRIEKCVLQYYWHHMTCTFPILYTFLSYSIKGHCCGSPRSYQKIRDHGGDLSCKGRKVLMMWSRDHIKTLCICLYHIYGHHTWQDEELGWPTKSCDLTVRSCEPPGKDQ